MPPAPVQVSLSPWKLDPGEESVLAVALQNPGSEVVIDDIPGRRCAVAHGIPLLGTLGVIILAKRIGKIVAARPVIAELRRVGLYVKDEVVASGLLSVRQESDAGTSGLSTTTSLPSFLHQRQLDRPGRSGPIW